MCFCCCYFGHFICKITTTKHVLLFASFNASERNLAFLDALDSIINDFLVVFASDFEADIIAHLCFLIVTIMVTTSEWIRSWPFFKLKFTDRYVNFVRSRSFALVTIAACFIHRIEIIRSRNRSRINIIMECYLDESGSIEVLEANRSIPGHKSVLIDVKNGCSYHKRKAREEKLETIHSFAWDEHCCFFYRTTMGKYR